MMLSAFSFLTPSSSLVRIPGQGFCAPKLVSPAGVAFLKTETKHCTLILGKKETNFSAPGVVAGGHKVK